MSVSAIANSRSFAQASVVKPARVDKPAPAAAPSDLVQLDQNRLGGLKAASQADKDFLAKLHILADVAPSGPPDNTPENVYAEVRVGDRVVATLYNSGASMLSSEAYGAIGALDEPNLTGPELAQWRAETYARMLGGTLSMASTAASQEQWQARPDPTDRFSREELDRALAAMQHAGDRRHAAYLAIRDLTV